MIDDKTTHLNLPKPHVNNLLSEDVERLRQGLDLIDSALHQISQSSTQPIADLQNEVARLNPLVEQLKTLSQTALFIPESTQVTRNAAGEISTVTEVIDGQSRITEILQRDDDRVVQYAITYLGQTTTYTINRNAGGDITGITSS
ncbi:MAG: hypothetical protein CR975_02120 [Gammaproteobacteria bacterium]|nr:MAG: hypothetical protein CR975_02120 [Gammaproteobacteria bacterium]